MNATLGFNRRQYVAAGFVILLLGTSGCQFVRGIGRPEGSLGGRGIHSMTLMLPKTKRLCPGSSAQLQVQAQSHEGAVYSTANKTSWGNFDITMQGGVVSPQGRLQLNGDPRLTWRRPASLEAILLHNPKVRASLNFEPRYDCDYRANFRSGRGKALRIDGTLDIIGDRNGAPVARLILSSDDTRRGGVFYLSKGATVTILLPQDVGESVGIVEIKVSPRANAFREAIRLSPATITGQGPNRANRLIFVEKELYLP